MYAIDLFTTHWSMEDKKQLHQALFNACSKGDLPVVNSLLCECQHMINLKDNTGRTMLHYACQGGYIDLVRNLICEHGADVNIRDDKNQTPLHVAARCGEEEIALCLINEYGCNPNVDGCVGRSLLHDACRGGNVNLVRTLLRDHKADVNAQDNKNSTPLDLAVFYDHVDVAMCLIHEFGSGANSKDAFSLDKSNSSISSPDTSTQELSLTGWTNQLENVLSLIKLFGADARIRTHLGKSLLHRACQHGIVDVVKALLEVLSPLLVDNKGNTPLHISSSNGHVNCMEILLHAKAPILIKNLHGKTPIDVATGEAQPFLQQYMKKNQEQLHLNYEAFRAYAEKKYSGRHPIARVFVLGNAGAGKSSLIESLKRENILHSFERLSESCVPPHTAGIVPSIHMSDTYGRVLFYDFAGDSEYYSSHAAILENLSSSIVGDNLFFIVVDIREDDITIENILYYWVSFIQHQKFNGSNLSLILVGSHSDQAATAEVAEKGELLESCCDVFVDTLALKHANYFMLDCCDPRVYQFGSLKAHFSSLIKQYGSWFITSEGSLLLGLLEKDFNEVTVCSLHTIISHIKDTGLCLPTTAKSIYPVIRSLHDIGVLLLLGDQSRGDSYVILNASKLTNEVHKLLFSKTSFNSIMRKYRLSLRPPFNIGIIPDTIIQEILPPHITEDCLIQLQYCQKISNKDIIAFLPVSTSDVLNQDFLFFPALCRAKKPCLESLPNLNYNISWLAHCSDPHDYLPPRFIHILLLRLVFKFTLSVPTQHRAKISTDHSLTYCQRRCTMWKTGINWLMTEGVECMVEFVDGYKGVVVIAKSSEDRMYNCITVFSKVISCVMEAKAEFCHSIGPSFFLLDSTDETNYLSPDNQFALSDVERALACPEGNDVILSVSGMKMMERVRFLGLCKLTHWHNLFPMDFNVVLYHLRDIVQELYSLGIELGISRSVLGGLEADFPFSTGRRRQELVRIWLSSSVDSSCWWHLVQALWAIDYRVLSAELEKKYGELYMVRLQLHCGNLTFD